MAKVKFGLSDHELSREEKGVLFSASGGKGKIGNLVVSKGGVRWYPKGSKKKHYFLSWEQLDKLMTDHVTSTT